MTVATILGAGAMGSAFAQPLSERGVDVRLWGTTLDDQIIRVLRQGEPHPRTGEAIADGVSLHASDELGAAVADCDLLVIAVASVGFEHIVALGADAVTRPPTTVVILTKGFAAGPSGRIDLLTEAADRILTARGLSSPVIGVGGPCKANEVSAGQPTWSVFAGEDRATVVAIADSVSTAAYRASTSTDPIGLEVSAALKNVFAVGLGMCDALGGRLPWHDLRAAVFTEAVWEMARVVEALGGRSETVLGLAGVGDLDVTGRSGRNRSLGERLGRGASPRAARDAMGELGLTVEGWAIAPMARQLLIERFGEDFLPELPLLDALIRILTDGLGPTDAGGILVGAVARGFNGRVARAKP